MSNIVTEGDAVVIRKCFTPPTWEKSQIWITYSPLSIGHISLIYGSSVSLGEYCLYAPSVLGTSVRVVSCAKSKFDVNTNRTWKIDP